METIYEGSDHVNQIFKILSSAFMFSLVFSSTFGHQLKHVSNKQVRRMNFYLRKIQKGEERHEGNKLILGSFAANEKRHLIHKTLNLTKRRGTAFQTPNCRRCKQAGFSVQHQPIICLSRGWVWESRHAVK